jgi:hypothetical protein
VPADNGIYLYTIYPHLQSYIHCLRHTYSHRGLRLKRARPQTELLFRFQLTLRLVRVSSGASSFPPVLLRPLVIHRLALITTRFRIFSILSSPFLRFCSLRVLVAIYSIHFISDYSDCLFRCCCRRRIQAMSDDNRHKPAASAGEAVQAGDQEKQKTYHTKATGQALETVKKHSGENELKLFGSCFW